MFTSPSNLEKMYSLYEALDGDNAADILDCLTIQSIISVRNILFLITYLYQKIRGLLTPRLDVNACMTTTQTNTS